MSIDIIVPENPDAAIGARLQEIIVAYNESKTGPSGLAPIAVMLEEDGKLVGGLWGRMVYDWLFVQYLIVPEHLRGQGFGKALLKKAEEIGLLHGCIGVWLDSFDFQAPGFYQKLGYEIIARLENPERGFSRNILRKRFAP